MAELPASAEHDEACGFCQGGFWLEEEARCELIGNDIFQNQKSGIQACPRPAPLPHSYQPLRG